MEEILKRIVERALEDRLGKKVIISQMEWENAKRDTLNDLYVNKFCFFEDVHSNTFLETMTDVLVVMIRSAT